MKIKRRRHLPLDAGIASQIGSAPMLIRTRIIHDLYKYFLAFPNTAIRQQSHTRMVCS